MKRIPTKISSKVDKNDLERFKRDYASSEFSRQIIADVLVNDLAESVREEENPKKLSSPNWQLLQAYDLGYRKALREVIHLLTIDEE